MFTANTKDSLKDVKSSASNIRDEALDTAYEVKDELRSAANQAGRRMRGFLNSATDELNNVTDSVTAQVRKNPVQSSLIALGAGFIIGSLLRR